VTDEFEPNKSEHNGKVYGFSIDPHSGTLASAGHGRGISPFGIATCRVENGRCKPAPL
jgi:hypothetical protein